MENNIPTAEEFFGFINGEIAYPPDFVHRTAIKFAKLHCEAQLKAILENVTIKERKKIHKCSSGSEYSYTTVVDKDSIANAYDLNQIK